MRGFLLGKEPSGGDGNHGGEVAAGGEGGEDGGEGHHVLYPAGVGWRERRQHVAILDESARRQQPCYRLKETMLCNESTKTAAEAVQIRPFAIRGYTAAQVTYVDGGPY